MSDIAAIPDSRITRWMVLDEAPLHEDAASRATVDIVRAALDGFENVQVVSVSVNRSGSSDTPQGRITDLPSFCDIRLHVAGAGGHVAHVVVWAPLQWNRRFLGTTGGGNRTGPQWIQPDSQRGPTLADAIRNGFATAATDGANRDPRPFAWALDEQTGELDRDLIENWVYRSIREMTLVATAVVEGIYGVPAEFSYLVGSSGGGRQVLEHARRYPRDYDGYWAADSAIDWSRFHVAQLWPPLVMKELGNPLPPAKLAAFRAAAIAAFDAEDGVVDGIIDSTEFTRWDARNAIGTPTPAGPLTETDARVMQLIWDGPVDSRGERLWYGVPIAADSWGGPHCVMGLCRTRIVDGELRPDPFFYALDWAASWVLRDPDWDWTTLTFQRFEHLFRLSTEELGSVDASDPDLTGLRRSGSKLLLSHGMADDGIPAEGTLDYYRRVVEAVGGEDEARSFLRFFLCPGDAHGAITGAGPGLTLASGMTAIMEWTERGEAPEAAIASKMDLETQTITMTRPVSAYPHVSRYVGGDPAEATSFEVTLPEVAEPGDHRPAIREITGPR